MNAPTKPCLKCAGDTKRQNTIARFGDRPEIHAFACESCERVTLFAHHDGQLEPWA
jgi:hypothetical protein